MFVRYCIILYKHVRLIIDMFMIRYIPRAQSHFSVNSANDMLNISTRKQENESYDFQSINCLL